uniref:Uncharacterized protein n=1 Tax=Gopherus agassizii TaxID=38772 RepID=A0A452H3W8_9SAUR
MHRYGQRCPPSVPLQRGNRSPHPYIGGWLRPEGRSIPQWRYHEEGGHRGARATQYAALRQGTALPLSACRTARAGCPICSRLAPIALPEPAGRIHRAMGPCQDWQVDYIGPLPPERR